MDFKKVLIILFCFTLFTSCDPEVNTVFIIKNSTSKILKLKLYASSFEEKTLIQGSSAEIINEEALGGIGFQAISRFDSIQLLNITDSLIYTWVKPNNRNGYLEKFEEKRMLIHDFYHESDWLFEEKKTSQHSRFLIIDENDLSILK